MTRLTFSPGAHRYYLADETTGKKKPVPAVSTLLNQLAKPALVGWAARTAAEYAVDHWEQLSHEPPAERRNAIATAHDKARNTAAAKGTTVHSFAEDLLAGRPVDVPEVLLDQVQGLARWWETSGWTRAAAETMVWSPEQPDLDLAAYAGTLDLLVSDKDGTRGLVDIKTGASGVWPDMAIQLAAYASADFMVSPEGDDVRMPLTDWWGVLHVRPEGTTFHRVPLHARRLAAERWDLLRSLRNLDMPYFEEVVA